MNMAKKTSLEAPASNAATGSSSASNAQGSKTSQAAAAAAQATVRPAVGSSAFAGLRPALQLRDDIAAHYFADENRLASNLIDRAAASSDERRRIDALALRLVEAARSGRHTYGGIDAFLHEYGLTSDEGIIMMCLAEALLRIPDRDTADALIADKMADGDWGRHLGASDSLFVNASTWGLMLTGRVVRLDAKEGSDPANIIKRLVGRSGKPIIREAMRQAMRIMGDQFVLGPTIALALGRAQEHEAKGYRFSYDMLGEAARTANDADRYFQRYMSALDAVGQSAGKLRDTGLEGLMARPGLSVKLSAIHPRFEPSQVARVERELVPRVVEMCRAAKARGLAITIDAEEAERLDITLQVFAQVSVAPELAGWNGLGLAVQAYGRRAIPVLRWLKRVAQTSGRVIPLRLVKGAYWDSEIKWAQERGHPDYPVLTRKVNTDVSYLACMRLLLSEREFFYPQFATHNAHTIASAAVAGGRGAFEFQRLHGMGQAVYAALYEGASDKLVRPCRIYAPVGGHEDLLPYLVRRLLENGANTSFVNRIADDAAPLAGIIRDPVEATERVMPRANPKIPKPADIFLPARRNSAGACLTEPAFRVPMTEAILDALQQPMTAGAIVGGVVRTNTDAIAVLSPHDRRVRAGTVHDADDAAIDEAISRATSAQRGWDRKGGAARAEILLKAADLFERNRERLMALMLREAGKTLDNALGDVREAVDFLRYYAVEAPQLFGAPKVLPGTTGERNEIALHGRGVFACISPWNFPLAIFTGQVAAALAAGNAVVAKPAEQTPLTAFLATKLLHEAGVPVDVLHLVPGDGHVGAQLVADKRIGGVVFTGSNETAWAIQKALAERRSAIVPFIAETGGINAMIVDSSALPEQVVRDVIRSAFDSAGQRCSALRVVLLQAEVADDMLAMLTGAMRELKLGDPLDFATDIGPVIDEDAMAVLEGHKLRMRRQAKELIDLPQPEACREGSYVTPALYEIGSLSELDREVFGPILHVVRYARSDLGLICEQINALGYGLTLGIHSRIADMHEFVCERMRAGNIYINRNQIGAVVGVQPFGGEGLSGTGPKAGGPLMLARLAVERVRTTDITATGGNAALLSIGTGED